MDELHQEFSDTTAVISWHINDEFTFEEGLVRANWFIVEGYPTVWFDGVLKTLGSEDPMFPVFLPIYEERIEIASNFSIEMEISEIGVNEYNINAAIELLEGVNTENLALFVVLTETDVESSGNANQNFVARNIYPDGMGMPVDFSTQTSQSFNTVITLEEESIFENCEVVIFIQNMDTKEIFQGTSLMMTDITTGIEDLQEVQMEIFPNPTSDRVTIKAGSPIEKIEIYNQVGQLVKQNNSKSKSVNLNVSELESGIYFIKVFSQNNVITRNLVIE